MLYHRARLYVCGVVQVTSMRLQCTALYLPLGMYKLGEPLSSCGQVLWRHDAQRGRQLREHELQHARYLTPKLLL